MIEPADLLTHAVILARGGTETDYRRAVSAAYYAVFHAMAWSGARLVSAGAPALVAETARAFEHAVMARVCQTYAKARHVDDRLVSSAKAFIDLQSARHEADYDLTAQFLYLRTQQLVASAVHTLSTWPEVAASDEGREFLLKLLLGSRLGRRG